MTKPSRNQALEKEAGLAARSVTESSPENDSGWTFLSNHFHVLILLAREPELSLREVSLAVGITERSVQRIVSDLEHGGYLQKEKVGRSNHYRMAKKQRLRHPIEAHCLLDDLLEIINRGAPKRPR